MVKQLETKLNSRALNGRDCGDDNKGAERGENEKEREGDIYLAEGNTPRSLGSPPRARRRRRVLFAPCQPHLLFTQTWRGCSPFWP